MYPHTHIYIYIYIHTHIYIYTYIYVYVSSLYEHDISEHLFLFFLHEVLDNEPIIGVIYHFKVDIST